MSSPLDVAQLTQHAMADDEFAGESLGDADERNRVGNERREKALRLGIGGTGILESSWDNCSLDPISKFRKPKLR